MPKPRAFQSFPSAFRLPYGPYNAVIDSYIDADTALFMLDPGVDRYPVVEVRFADVWAPERRDSERHALALAELERLMPLGTACRVHTRRTRSFVETKTFTRYVGLIERVDGSWFNADYQAWLEAHGLSTKEEQQV